MKITFVMASGFTLVGGDRVIATHAQRLKQRGHEVFVISRPKYRPNLRQQMKSLLKGQGWISEAENEPSHFDGLDVPRRLLDHYRPVTDADVPDADVVIATWWETAEWVANLSESKGAKAYFIQHYEAFDYLPKERVAATWLLPLHKITISKWLVDLARTQYGDDNVSLVRNSVDSEKFYAPPRSRHSTPTIGMLYAATSYWKGCDISLKAFSLAAQKIPNLRLVSFGFDRPAPGLPLPPNTEYACRPAQSTLKDFYAKCDAWLFGSRSEGFGMPILEAMACRTPVIGTPTGAASELLTNGAGILVKLEDPEDMARAIEQIIQLSDAEWQMMSDAAYAQATSYSWDDATELFEAALHTATERRKRGEFMNLAAPKLD